MFLLLLGLDLLCFLSRGLEFGFVKPVELSFSFLTRDGWEEESQENYYLLNKERLINEVKLVKEDRAEWMRWAVSVDDPDVVKKAAALWKTFWKQMKKKPSDHKR